MDIFFAEGIKGEDEMKVPLPKFALAVGLVAGAFNFAEGIGKDEAITTALGYLKMDEDDLDLSPEATEDPFRLRIVDHLLARPLRSARYADSLALSLAEESSLRGKLVLIASQLDLTPGTHLDVDTVTSKNIEAIVAELRVKISEARELVGEALSGVSDGEMEFLRRESSLILKEDVRDKDKGLFELEEEGRRASKVAEGVFSIVERIRREKMLEAGLLVLEEVERVAGALGKVDLRSGGVELSPEVASGEVLYYERAPWGDVIVGGPGSNVYRGKFAVIIDLGGDDQYLGNAGGTLRGELPVSICVDLGGDDLYLGHEEGAVGSGFLGIGVLMDLGGDDVYRAGFRNLGSGWIGVGFLVDEEGDDRYLGDTFVQGAGFIGVGFLGDYGGNDLYLASAYSQGFGFVGGFGCIEDGEGNDFYLAGSKYEDLFRSDLPRYISMCQGVGLGYRPDCSGGIGLISELSGNDTYIADVFGQGASYWYSLGCIVDRGGNDTYKAYDYGQGAGVHISVGTLADLSGDDCYVSKGVSQGEGHDLGVGYLLDESGDDIYVASDLSQGAASHHGLGVLLDGGGDDGYLSKDRETTRGHGRFSYGFGSVGIFLDLGGEDLYSPKGKDRSFWTGTSYGVGIDFPYPSRRPPRKPERVEVEEREYTLEELFTMAKCGYPKFSKLAEYGRKKLISNPEESVPYLLSVMGTEQARARHCIRKILKEIGVPAVKPLVRALKSEDLLVVTLAAQTLGEIGDVRAEKPLLKLLRSHEWRVISSAATALGKLGSGKAVDDLIALLGHESRFVRKSAAVALGRIGDPKAIPALIKALSDPSYAVRYPAKDALVKFGRKAVPKLLETLKSPPPSLYFAVQALGEIGDGRAVGPLVELSKAESWEDPKLRTFVVEALAEFPRSRDAMEMLKELSDDKDWFVRRRAGLELRKLELEGTCR